MNSRRVLLVLLTVFPVVASQEASAAKRKEVPMAPLPAKIVAAKKVFLANGGGSDLAL
jgi:hypothetical protein